MKFRSFVGIGLFLAAVGGFTAFAAAFQGPSSSSAEAAVLAQGWAALAKGDVARAGAVSAQALATYPGSALALALAVEVDLTRGGRLAGLDTYERWLGSRKVDEAHVLRRIALAFVRSVAAESPDARAKLEALKALVAEGDPAAQKSVVERAAGGNFGERRILASAGDARAVNLLIADLRSPTGNKLLAMSALGESGSRLAVAPLLEALADPRPEYRAAAADAVGRLHDQSAIERLRPLLEDASSVVRIAAAGALYRLDDMSGFALLQSQLNSQYPGVRVGAADIMSSHPDAQWQAVTRALTSDSDPSVRLVAARLIAPYDPDLAASTLDGLLNDGNLAIREEAARVFSQRVARDFASLRRLLRSGDSVTAVQAAARILELTR